MEVISKIDAAAANAAHGDSVLNDDDHARIGEMAKAFGVTLRALRFYEDKGMLRPRREGSTRLYSKADRARLKLILFGRKVGFTLRDVKHMIDLYDPRGSNGKQLKYTLDKSEKQLVRLNSQRRELDEAISELSESMKTIRRMLADRGMAGSAG